MEDPQEVAAMRPKWLALGVAAVLLGLILRAAWVTEDAYITLRTVDNWVNGFGLRWNTSERVQGYTHPLWMVLLSIPYFLTREAYFTAVLLGVATTCAGLWVLVRAARSAGHAVVALSLLLVSRSYVEFSTSGLENPLTHLLVGAFIVLYLRPEVPLRALTLSAALLSLSRTDALVVALPALVHAGYVSLRARGLRTTARDVVIGACPLLAWELFSLFYYGFLVPNTAFAKLNTGLPRDEVVRQGLTYVLNAVAWDPPLLVIVALGVGAALLSRRLPERLLALGVLLYVVYVVRIGGDFMLGRFLTLPLFVATCLLAVSRLPLELERHGLVVLMPFLALFLHPSATEKYPVGDFLHSGVADERMYYREGSGLMMFTRQKGVPSHPWATAGREARTQGDKILLRENIGFFGYFAGPRAHIVDANALSEPLLARLPARYNPDWRVGHFTRHVPEGYTETIRTGVCAMPDASLCEYHAKLQQVVAGDLVSWERFKAIAGLNLGVYDYLIDVDRYRHPETKTLPLADVGAELAEGAPFDSPGAHSFGHDGLAIDLGRLSHDPLLRVSLDFNDAYTIELRRGGVTVGRAEVAVARGPGLRTRRIAVDKQAQTEGFDRVVIRPGLGDGFYAAGFVRLGR